MPKESRVSFVAFFVFLFLFIAQSLGHATPGRRSATSSSAATRGQNSKATQKLTRRKFMERTAAVVLTGAGLTYSRTLEASSKLKSAKQTSNLKQAGKNNNLRVVTTTPSGTELVEALKRSEQLVGVDNFSSRPKGERDVARVGDVVTPDTRVITNLKPDLVILDEEQSPTRRQLERKGIKTYSTKMTNTVDVQRALSELGTVLDAQEQAASVNRDISAALSHERESQNGQRALVIVDRGAGQGSQLRSAGPGSQLHELLTRAGFDNVLAHSNQAYPNIHLEEALKRGVDLIIDLSEGGNADAKSLNIHLGGGELRIKTLSNSLFLSPTPRVREAIAELSRLKN